MSGSILENKADSRTTKTLYTPVLYHHVPELSASSTPETGHCSTYLKRLTREHLARASMEEIGSSVAFSPASQARVSKWTAKVKRAFAEANGNVADGRWALVSDLLRLHCTRGGPRWLGVNLDLQAPEVPKQLCIIPKTSEEWDDLERRIEGEDDVNSKVQRWIRSAEFTPLSPGATVNQSQTLHGVSSLSHRDPNPSAKVTQTSLKTGFSMSHPLSSGSKFGFNVVKRPNVFIKDSTKSRNSPSSPPPPDPNLPSTSHIPDHSDHEPSHETVHPSSPIINQSLKPLPFPDSQIQTSTPLPNPQDDIRNSNLSCEPSPMALGRAGFSDQTHREGDVTSNRKRARSGSLEPPVAKRPRSAAEESGHPSSSQLRPEAAELPVTPSTVRNLPRLTELLALSPHQKHNTPREGASKIPVDSSPFIHTSDARDHPVSPELHVKDPDDPATNSPRVPVSEMPLTTLQLGVSTTKTPGISSDITGHDLVHPQPAIQPAVGPVLEEDDDVPSIIEEALKVYEPRPHTPVHPPPLQKDQFHFPNDPKLLMSKLDAKTYNLYGLDLLDNSPAKSLSSLAGSDADSDSDSDFGNAQTLEKIIEIVPEQLHQHPVDPDFNPRATSTQKPGLEINLASNMGLSGHATLDNLDWGNDHLSSTSQLQAEVNGQVNEFDKFMEADLSYDQVVSGF